MKDSKVYSVSLPIAAWEQAEHWSAGGEQLLHASLVTLGFYSLILFHYYFFFIIIITVVIISVVILCLSY